MKLWLLIGAIVVVVGGGAAVFVITKGNSDNSAKVTNQATGDSIGVKTGSEAFIAVDACDVFTQAAADQAMGPGATKADTSAGNASSADISVSNCNYTKKANTGNPLEDAKNGTSAGVLARAARTRVGADSNKAVFGSQKPSGVVDVAGYGDKAFFNPAYGQLNILKGNNWYILSMYTGLHATQATQADAIKLADALKANLK